MSTSASPAPLDPLDPLAPTFVERRRRDVGPPAGVADRRVSDALKMACPWCAASSSGVVRTRGLVRTDAVSRTRRCYECGRTFPTLEQLDETRFEAERAAAEAAATALEPAA